MARLMGAAALYLQLLHRFADDYADAPARLRLALDAGQTDVAGRLAHTLKGAAGLIGAGQVHALATALDTALRSTYCGSDTSPSAGSDSSSGCNSSAVDSGALDAPARPALEALKALEAALCRLFEQIRQVERQTPPPAATTAAPPTKGAADAAPALPAGQLCRLLAQLLRDGNGAAIDLLERTAAQLAAHLGEAAWRRLDAAAQRFDFETALAVLAAAGDGDAAAPLSG
ncbi:Hpt domain-containing protein [Rugamonas sp. CCM 8940]|nr:Hpt domain-containing protein [Rugamonas sp. CCM 8940]